MGPTSIADSIYNYSELFDSRLEKGKENVASPEVEIESERDLKVKLKPAWYETKKVMHTIGKFFLGTSAAFGVATTYTYFYFQARPEVVTATFNTCATATFLTALVGIAFLLKQTFWKDPAFCREQIPNILIDIQQNKLSYTDIRKRYGQERMTIILEQLDESQKKVLSEAFLVLIRSPEGGLAVPYYQLKTEYSQELKVFEITEKFILDLGLMNERSDKTEEVEQEEKDAKFLKSLNEDQKKIYCPLFLAFLRSPEGGLAVPYYQLKTVHSLEMQTFEITEEFILDLLAKEMEQSSYEEFVENNFENGTLPQDLSAGLRSRLINKFISEHSEKGSKFIAQVKGWEVLGVNQKELEVRCFAINIQKILESDFSSKTFHEFITKNDLNLLRTFSFEDQSVLNGLKECFLKYAKAKRLGLAELEKDFKVEMKLLDVRKEDVSYEEFRDAYDIESLNKAQKDKLKELFLTSSSYTNMAGQKWQEDRNILKVTQEEIKQAINADVNELSYQNFFKKHGLIFNRLNEVQKDILKAKLLNQLKSINFDKLDEYKDHWINLGLSKQDVIQKRWKDGKILAILTKKIEKQEFQKSIQNKNFSVEIVREKFFEEIADKPMHQVLREYDDLFAWGVVQPKSGTPFLETRLINDIRKMKTFEEVVTHYHSNMFEYKLISKEEPYLAFLVLDYYQRNPGLIYLKKGEKDLHIKIINEWGLQPVVLKTLSVQARGKFSLAKTCRNKAIDDANGKYENRKSLLEKKQEAESEKAQITKKAKQVFAKAKTSINKIIIDELEKSKQVLGITIK